MRGSAAATGAYLLVVLTFGAYLPSTLYPAYQQDFGAGDLTMTLVYATFALVSAPALVLFGQAADVVGPRPVLRGAVVVAAAGSASFVFASDIGWLVAGRAAQGLALGAATAAASSLTAVHAGRRVDGAALAGIAFVGGTAAGPVVGGLMARYVPAPETVPFAVHLVLLAVGWRLVSRLGTTASGMTVAPVGAPHRAWRPTVPRIPRAIRRLFVSAAVTGFLAWTVAGLFLAIIPTLLERSGPADPAVTGAILGSVLLCSVATQPLVGRVGVRGAQIAGAAALLTSLVVLAVNAGGSTATTLAAAVIAGVGHGLAYGGASAAVDAVAPVAHKGAITGALHVAFYLGSGCPAVVVGLITLVHPLPTATSWVAAAAAIGTVGAAASVVAMQRPATAPEGPIVAFNATMGPSGATRGVRRALPERVEGRCPAAGAPRTLLSAGAQAGGRQRMTVTSPDSSSSPAP
ncbi:MFS transporter [Prauserella rugosa]|uniref:Putative MFS family arabinose efflux permease n=1 Tax=Prauserella rugosa TaxID=43354 RepID=A0A660CCD6_9PSEU|nr:MFS transporter [Prauserella rugosa]TWH18581.1 putative MFS family arabinose efflux permease [Prauserella rugosa]